MSPWEMSPGPRSAKISTGGASPSPRLAMRGPAAAVEPTIRKSWLLQALHGPTWASTSLPQPLQDRRLANRGFCRRCGDRRLAKRAFCSRCRTDDWPNVSPAVAARPNVAQKKHSVAAVEPTIGKSWLLQRLQARRFGNGGFCSRCRERLGALVWTRKLISEPLFRKLPLLSRTPKLGSARVARVRSGVAPERSCPPSSSGMGRQKSEHTRFSARRRKRHARGVPSPAPQRSPGFDFGDRVYRFPAVSNGKSGEPRLLRVRLSAAVPRVSASEQKREDLIGGGSRNGS